MKQIQTHFSYYTNKTVSETLAELETQAVSALNQNQVAERRRIYGFNSVQTQQISLIARFLHQFANPFIYLLLGSATLYFFLKTKSKLPLL